MSREDNRWSAGCGESRMSGVKWGKRESSLDIV